MDYKGEFMSKGRIIVVDDDRLMQLTIKEILLEYNFEVVAIYSTGEEAVYNAPNHKPDLILMDIELSGYMDGIEASQRIKSVLDIPIIFISGMDDEGTIERSKCTDPLGYLLKPFKAKELLILIEMALFKNKTLKQLKLNEYFIKSTFNSISEGMLSIDEKGDIKLANPVSANILGISHNKLLNKNLFDLLQTKSKKLEKFLIQSIEEKKWHLKYTQAFEEEFEILKTNSDEQIFKPVYISISPLYDTEEKIMGYVLVLRDLTEQKKTRDLINKLFIAVKQSPIGVMMISPEETIDYINPKFEEITEFQAEEILGKPVDIIHNEKLPKEKIKQIWESIRNGKELCFEWENYKKSGKAYWEFITITPVKNDKNEIIQYISLKEDITEKKNFEVKLLQNEKKYKDLFNNTPVAICNIDISLVCQYIRSLQENKISNFKEYFRLNPQYFNNCIDKFKATDVNSYSKNVFELTEENDINNLPHLLFSDNSDFTINLLEHISLAIETLSNESFNNTDLIYLPQNDNIKINLNNKQEKHLHIVWFCVKDNINPNTNNFNSISKILLVAVDVTDKILTESLLITQTFHLKERIKEQNTLFEINNVLSKKELSIEQTLHFISNQLITAFQHPGNTAIKIEYNEKTYLSVNYNKLFKTDDNNSLNIEKHSEDIVINDAKVGFIEVFTLKDKSLIQEKPAFYKEEIEVIKTTARIISDYISHIINVKTIDKKLKYESLISKISAGFLSVDDFEKVINTSLADIGEKLDADRTYIFEFNDKQNTISNTFEWCKNQDNSQKAKLQNINFNKLPWIRKKIIDNQIIYIEDTTDMPNEAINDQKIILEDKTVSFLILPLTIKEYHEDKVKTKIIGFLGLDDLSVKKPWENEDIALLKMFSDIVSNSFSRKNAFNLLKNQKTFSNAIIDSVAELIIVLDLSEKDVITFNKHCEKLSGYKHNEINTYQDFKNLFITEQIDYLEKQIEKTINQNQINDIELFWKTKDKRFLIINWQFNLIYDEFANPVYIIINGTNITNERKNESLLKDKESQYRTIIQNLNIGIYRTTGLKNGHFLQANIALSKMLGYDSTQELMLKNEKDIFLNTTDRDEFLKNTINKGSISNFEVQLVKKQYDINKPKDNIIWVKINAKAIYDHSGIFKWLDAFVEDITETKITRKEINKQLQFLQTVIDNNPIPTYYTKYCFNTSKQTIIGCNKSFEDFIKQDKQNIINKDLQEIIQPDIYKDFTKNDLNIINNILDNPDIKKSDLTYSYNKDIKLFNKIYTLCFNKTIYVDNEELNDYGIINSITIINCE